MNKVITTKLSGIAQHFRDIRSRSVTEVVNSKRPLLVLYSVFIAIYLVLKAAAYLSRVFSVFEFALIAILFGFAPAYFFRRVFKFTHILGWVANAGALGILLIPFAFLLFGWLGINFVFSHSILFLYLCSVAGMLALLFADTPTVKALLQRNGLRRFDTLAYIVLFLSTVMLTVRHFDRVSFAWDSFTFWGVAAKYIYEFKRLPTASLDIFSAFAYTSYQPIFFSIMYDLYQGIVEQYGTWVNTFINLIAVLLIYNKTTRKDIATKSITLALLVIVSFASIRANYLLTMYADVLCAFILLLYVLFLTDDSELRVETFSQRAWLILLPPTALFFIKSPFLPVTLLLIGAWLVYDFKFMWGNRKALLRRPGIWIAVASVVVLYVLRYYYINYTLDILKEIVLIDPETTGFISTLRYTFSLLGQLTSRNGTVFWLWIFSLLSAFWVVGKRKAERKQYLLTFFVTFAIAFFFIAVYILNQRSLSSGSLVRYTSIVIYLIPLVLFYLPVQVQYKQLLPLALIFTFIAGYNFYPLLNPYLAKPEFKLATGSFSVHLGRHSALANKVRRAAGEDARILIADENKLGQFSNMFTPAIYIRYFLMENSVGGQYQRLNREELFDYAQEYQADYILLISQDETFTYCDKVFSGGHHYLVKVKQGMNYKEMACPFTENSLIDLSK